MLGETIMVVATAAKIVGDVIQSTSNILITTKKNELENLNELLSTVNEQDILNNELASFNAEDFIKLKTDIESLSMENNRLNSKLSEIENRLERVENKNINSSISTFINNLKKHIINKGIDNSFLTLDKSLKPKSRLYNDYFLIKFRLKTIKEERLIGVITINQYVLESNKVIMSFMNLLDKIDAEDLK